MTSIKFAHIADCHLGSWRDPKLRDLNTQNFCDVIDSICKEKVEFVIIAGDLFNTAIPSIDILKIATEKLKQLTDAGIRVYGIAGSHDYSAAGKSMLEVLEKAKLFTNVMKGNIVDGKLQLSFIQDPSGIKLTGVLGKRGTLEKSVYESLDYDVLEKEEGEKIFVFHSAITEIAEMPGYPLEFLPKGFSYYAGGHVHIRAVKKPEHYGTIVYPGPVFPNSFSELEALETGSFVIVDNGRVIEKKVPVKKIVLVQHTAKQESGIEVIENIRKKCELRDISDAIVLIRINGTVTDAIPSFQELYDELYSRGAYHILRNTVALNIPTLEEYSEQIQDINKIEQEIISEKIHESFLKNEEGKEIDLEAQKKILEQLLHTLTTTKKDGETVADYEERIHKEFIQIQHDS